MCYPMLMGRIKKTVGLALDPDLLDQIETWRRAQDVPPSKTAVLEAALACLRASSRDVPKSPQVRAEVPLNTTEPPAFAEIQLAS